MHKAAHFAGLHSFGARIVEEENPFCTMNQPVEIIGRDGILMFGGGEFKTTAQVVRDKTICAAFGWKNTFVERSDNQVFEVESAGFEHAHNLQTIQRFTNKRN